MAVATILADWGMDKNMVISGLLHDTIEDTTVSKEDIINRYGEDVLHLVESVTNLSGIKFNSRNHKKAENFIAKNIPKNTASPCKILFENPV